MNVESSSLYVGLKVRLLAKKSQSPLRSKVGVVSSKKPLVTRCFEPSVTWKSHTLCWCPSSSVLEYATHLLSCDQLARICPDQGSVSMGLVSALGNPPFSSA